MRLTNLQLSIIKESFRSLFCFGDSLWLFGSRADDTKRGGDIDLYLETTEVDRQKAYKKKSDFWIDLQNKLGEQKIDIIVNQLSEKKDLEIYTEARNTGILLMKKEIAFNAYIENIEIHATRLSMALEDTTKMLPITAHTMSELSKEGIYILEMLNSRFSKMQDDIGSKIFPYILNFAGEKTLSFIDNLNTLEKLAILESANWWLDLRKLRNEIAHDYDNKYDELAAHTNQLVTRVKELLNYWTKLKPKLEIIKNKAMPE